MSKTPIEIAAEVMAEKFYPGLDVEQFTRNYLSDTARAVFESLPEDEVERRLMNDWHADNCGCTSYDGSDSDSCEEDYLMDEAPEKWTIGDIKAALLTGGES